MFETALAVACVSSASLCLCRRLRSSRVRCAGRPGFHHSTHPSTNPTPATLATVYPVLSALNVPSDSTSLAAVPRRRPSPSLPALVPCRLPPLTLCLLALLVLPLLPSILLYFYFLSPHLHLSPPPTTLHTPPPHYTHYTQTGCKSMSRSRRSRPSGLTWRHCSTKTSSSKCGTWGVRPASGRTGAATTRIPMRLSTSWTGEMKRGREGVCACVWN